MLWDAKERTPFKGQERLYQRDGVKYNIPAAVEYAVYDHGVHAAAYHVYGHDEHHAYEVPPCFGVELDEGQEQGSEREHDEC